MIIVISILSMIMCISIIIIVMIMLTINPHLGLINAPPPYLFSPSKRPFSLFIYYQKGRK